MPSGPRISLRGDLHRLLHEEAARRQLKISQALEQAIELWAKSEVTLKGEVRRCLHPYHRQTNRYGTWFCDPEKGGCGAETTWQATAHRDRRA